MIETAPVSSAAQFRSQIRNAKRSRILLIAGILLLVTVLSWVFISVFAVKDSSEASDRARALVTPLSPTLDIELLNSLRSKRVFTPEELASFTIYRIIKDRSGKESIIPTDTPIEEIRRLTGETTAAQPTAANPNVFGENKESGTQLSQ